MKTALAILIITWLLGFVFSAAAKRTTKAEKAAQIARDKLRRAGEISKIASVCTCGDDFDNFDDLI